MSTLDLRGITHRFPDAGHDTLDAVDLGVVSGELLAVLGPSGSGKSTLLRVAAGLDRPTSGEVLLDGQVVTSLPPERRALTVMFQEPQLFGHLDVLGNVAFGPRMAGAGRREAERAARRHLDLVHLGDLARRRVGRLSGGQQQRVALARALATERRVLLLDEPFSALDPDLRTSMHDLLAEVRGALAPTVVMVTHDLDEASLADRVAVLVAGRLQQVCEVPDLYRRPATLAVARLVGGFAEVPGTARSGVHLSDAGAVSLPVGCPADGPATLLVRREQLRVAAVDEVPAGEWRVSGTVTGVRRRGPRLSLQVDPTTLDPTSGPGTRGARLEVELALDDPAPPDPGTRVDVALVPGATPWAVAD